MLCCNKYKKLRSLKPHLVPFNYSRYPMHIEEVKIVKNEQDTIIYKKKPSYSKHLNTQAATASLINSYFAPIIYNASDEYKTAIANRIAAGLENTNTKSDEDIMDNNQENHNSKSNLIQNFEINKRNSLISKDRSEIKLNDAFENDDNKRTSIENENYDRKLSMICKNDSTTLFNQAYKGHQSLDIEYIEMDDLDITLENHNTKNNKSVESPPKKDFDKPRNLSIDYVNLNNRNIIDSLITENGSNQAPIASHHQYHKASISGRIRYPVGASSTMANRATQNKRNQYAKSKYVVTTNSNNNNNNNNTNTLSSNAFFTLESSNNTTTDKSIDSLHHLINTLEVRKSNENLAMATSTTLINENRFISNSLHKLRTKSFKKHSTAPTSQAAPSTTTNTQNETSNTTRNANLLDPQCIPYAVRQSLISLHYQLHKKPPLLQFSRISRSDSFIRPRIKRSTSLNQATLLSEKNNNPLIVNKNKDIINVNNNKQDLIVVQSNHNAIPISLVASSGVIKKNSNSKSLKRHKSHYEQHDSNQ